MDQSLFAAPHGLSQRITSFFACACQGIHQMPLRHLIVLIANAHLSAANAATPLPFTTERSKISSAYLFDDSPTGNTPSVSRLSSDQLLEIMSGDARSGNINLTFRQRPFSLTCRIVPSRERTLRVGAKLLATGLRPTKIGQQRDSHYSRFQPEPPDMSSLHNFNRTGKRSSIFCKPFFFQNKVSTLTPEGLRQRAGRPATAWRPANNHPSHSNTKTIWWS